ncbi:unnamed protein product [Echinostoma caproni]|uniref:Zf-C2HC5 domain-containing protein n=1 Tax=Echinostoma caproni TaxID=27848 RepID=A0A183BAQ2_9TREM|nr:unnamed protein product [Echinostoma caproni]
MDVGYRKTDTHPNAPADLKVERAKEKKEPVEKTQQPEPSNTTKTKCKPKFYPLFSEGARGDELVAHLPGRHPCQCLATKHQLINNCTNCGRIVCTQEGSGPCYFCGQLVCSKEEKQTIALGTKQAIKLRNRLLQVPWAPGTEEPMYRVRRRAELVAAKKRDLLATSPKVDWSHSKPSELPRETSDNSDDVSDEFAPDICTPVAGAQQRLEEGKS